MGMGAGAAQYGVMMADFYWIGAIPAMVFVGWVMIRFYYRSGANSVPGYLRRRYNEATRGYQAALFLLMTLMMGGINMYAMALIINFLLKIPFDVSLWVASGVTLFYILMGGLSSAIYNEVLQLFIIFVGLIPLTILGFIGIGGLGALQHAAHVPTAFTHVWKYAGSTNNPFKVSWIPIVFGLGFVLSFGYWGTDFLVMQRAMAARNERRKADAAARRLPEDCLPLPGHLAGPRGADLRSPVCERTAHAVLQHGHPLRDGPLLPERASRRRPRGADRLVHERPGRQRLGLQHDLDLRHLQVVHPPAVKRQAPGLDGPPGHGRRNADCCRHRVLGALVQHDN